MGHDVKEKQYVCFYTTDVHLKQCAAHPLYDELPAGRPRGVLNQQAIVEWCYSHAAVADAVDAHPRALPVAVHRQGAGVGGKVAFHVLSRDTTLHGNAPRFDILLFQTQILERRAPSDENLTGTYAQTEELTRYHDSV